jgi:hypothetical protein
MAVGATSLTPFTYRLDAHDGHRFDPPPSEFETEICQIILNWAGYSELPVNVPFVGHFPLPKGAYVVLSKPAGEQGYDGWVLSGLQYAAHKYSPYAFLAENAPKMGIDRAPGPPLDASRYDHTLSDSSGYLKTAARIFSGFDDARRLSAHRSVAAPDRDGVDALFVLPRIAQTPPAVEGLTPMTPTPADELSILRNDVVKLRGLVETMRSQAQPIAADMTARIANLGQRLTDIETALRVATEVTERLSTQRKNDTAKVERAATHTAAIETQVADLADTVRARSAAHSGGRLRWALPVAATAVLVAAGGIAYTAISTRTMSGQLSQTIAAQLGDADNPAAGTVRRQLLDVQNRTSELSTRIEDVSGRLGDPAQRSGVFAQLTEISSQLAQLSGQMKQTLGGAGQLGAILVRLGKLEKALGNTNPSDTDTALARLAALEATNPLERVGKIEEILGDSRNPASGTVLEQLGSVKTKAEAAFQFLQDTCAVLANVKDVEQRILALCQSSFPQTQQAGQRGLP